MAKYNVTSAGQFKKDLKLAKKSGLDLNELFKIVDNLADDIPLAPNNHNHLLQGEYKGCWECHISPDWLLIYTKEKTIRLITLKRTGTHADLFDE